MDNSHIYIYSHFNEEKTPISSVFCKNPQDTGDLTLKFQVPHLREQAAILGAEDEVIYDHMLIQLIQDEEYDKR